MLSQVADLKRNRRSPILPGRGYIQHPVIHARCRDVESVLMKSGNIWESAHINTLGHIRCRTALETVEVQVVLINF